jgi:hypothetical protein
MTRWSRTDTGIWLGLVLVIILFVVYHAHAQRQFQAQGFAPATLILEATFPDAGQVCAAPAHGDLVACRSAKDVRLFLRARPAAPTAK